MSCAMTEDSSYEGSDELLRRNPPRARPNCHDNLTVSKPCISFGITSSGGVLFENVKAIYPPERAVKMRELGIGRLTHFDLSG
jgi:hypothetical protein